MIQRNDFIAVTQGAEQAPLISSEPVAKPTTATTKVSGFSQVVSYAEEPDCSSEESNEDADDAGWNWKQKLAAIMAMLLLGLAGWNFSASSYDGPPRPSSQLRAARSAGSQFTQTSQSNVSSRSTASTHVQVAPELAAPAGWEFATANIEDIRVGMRVPALNPQMSAEERAETSKLEIDPRTWHQVQLNMPRPDQGPMQITFLRSEAWIRRSIQLANGQKLTGPISAAVGQEIELVIPEVGVDGFAQVVSIEPCPPITDGPGDVVTATFYSQSARVLNLQIESIAEPLGVTPAHPIWSQTRQQFVPAGELAIGEELSLISGETVRLTDISPRDGPADVFNFEVANEHVYHVTDQGLLVHNSMYLVKGSNSQVKKFGTTYGGVSRVKKTRNPVKAPNSTVRKTLYHYTDEAGQQGILSSKRLNASTKAANPKDVGYGNGQYVTDFAPETKTPAQLSREFLGQPFQGKKFTHYVEIDVTDLNVIKGRNGVYVIPNDVPLDITDLIIGSGKVVK